MKKILLLVTFLFSECFASSLLPEPMPEKYYTYLNKTDFTDGITAYCDFISNEMSDFPLIIGFINNKHKDGRYSERIAEYIYKNKEKLNDGQMFCIIRIILPEKKLKMDLKKVVNSSELILDTITIPFTQISKEQIYLNKKKTSSIQIIGLLEKEYVEKLFSTGNHKLKFIADNKVYYMDLKKIQA